MERIKKMFSLISGVSFAVFSAFSLISPQAKSSESPIGIHDHKHYIAVTPGIPGSDCDESGHSYGETQYREPTCTTQGCRYEICTVCGASRSFGFVAALGHNWKTVSVLVAPTCSNTGTASQKCSRCEETQTAAIEKTSHTPGTTHVDKATCTSKGEKYSYCTECGVKVVLETIDELGHDMQLISSHSGTCTEESYKNYGCSRCDHEETFYGEVDQDAHSKAGESIRKEATCTEDGEVYYVCDLCGKKIVEETLPAKHDTFVYSHSVGTCIDKECTIIHCKNCDYKETNYGNKDSTNHSYGEVQTVQPTCTENGETYQVCSDCGHKKTISIINMTGHTLKETSHTPGTCSKKETTVFSCDNCDYTETVFGDISEDVHDWVISENTPATCVNDYHFNAKCRDCGQTIDRTEDKNPDNHTHLGEEIVVNPTCEETGETYRICSDCGEKVVISTTSNLGHEYEDRYIAPKCEEDGGNYRVCTRCNKTIIDKKEPALGHKWVVSNRTDGTCGSNEIVNYKCSLCGSTKTEEGEKAPTNHTFGEIETIPATCTQTGEQYHVCTGCGYKETTAILEKAEHSYGEKQRIEPSCTEPGEEYEVCKDCGYRHKISTLEACGHSMRTIEDSESTCTEYGVKIEVCDKCDYKIETTKTTLKEHNYVTTTIPATSKENGYTKVFCTTCGTVLTEKVLYATGCFGSITVLSSAASALLCSIAIIAYLKRKEEN